MHGKDQAGGAEIGMESDPEFDRIVEGIDANLDYLHKERWAQRAAELREAERRAEGDEAKARAHQALLDHYHDMLRPETSRDALVEQAAANLASRRGVRAWMERTAETTRRLSSNPELLRSIEQRGF